MKLNELKIGKWYRSMYWDGIFVKCADVNLSDNTVEIGNNITSEEGYNNKPDKFPKYYESGEVKKYYGSGEVKDWVGVDVTYSAIQSKLPIGHPDKTDYSCRYYKLLKEFSNRHVGEVFDILEDKVPKYKYWNKDWTWKDLLNKSETSSKYFEPICKAEYDEEISKFPVSGYCYNNDHISSVLSHLKTTRSVNDYNEKDTYIYWNALCYWSGENNLEGYKAISTAEAKQKLSKTNNLKLNKDEQQKISTDSNSDEICGPTSSISRRIRAGTIVNRYRGQQASTGSRPEGNRTSPSVRKTGIRSVKISASIVRTRYY